MTIPDRFLYLGANNSEYERGVYTAKLVSSTSTTSADQSHSLPAIESTSTTSMVAATRGAVSQHFQQQQHSDAKSADSKMAGTGDVPAVAPPQSLLLSSPAFESVTLRRSPVTSPARNRSVRSDFILNLVQQGINNTSEVRNTNKFFKERTKEKRKGKGPIKRITLQNYRMVLKTFKLFLGGGGLNTIKGSHSPTKVIGIH